MTVRCRSCGKTMPIFWLSPQAIQQYVISAQPKNDRKPATVPQDTVSPVSPESKQPTIQSTDKAAETVTKPSSMRQSAPPRMIAESQPQHTDRQNTIDAPDVPAAIGCLLCASGTHFHYLQDYSVASIDEEFAVLTVIAAIIGAFISLAGEAKYQIITGVVLCAWNYVIIFLITQSYPITDWIPKLGFILYNLGYLLVLIRGIVCIRKE